MATVKFARYHGPVRSTAGDPRRLRQAPRHRWRRVAARDDAGRSHRRSGRARREPSRRARVGQQWLPEPKCTGYPDGLWLGSDAASRAGCRDPFGFVPLRVEADVPVVPGEPATISLIDLPTSDVLVGDITARVVYGSFVLLRRSRWQRQLRSRAREPDRRDGAWAPAPPGSNSNLPVSSRRVYGASFMTMTAAGSAALYREGAFVETAFYPRVGCADPPPAFSIIGASGFSSIPRSRRWSRHAAGRADLSQCSQGSARRRSYRSRRPRPTSTPSRCTENTADSSVRYREPRATSPTSRIACSGAATADARLRLGSGPHQTELIVTGRSDDSCNGLTHYVLRGCTTDPAANRRELGLHRDTSDRGGHARLD